MTVYFSNPFSICLGSSQTWTTKFLMLELYEINKKALENYDNSCRLNIIVSL